MRVKPEYSKYSISYAGVATPLLEKKDVYDNLVKFDGVYRITEAVLCRMKNAELAVYGKGKALGLNQFLITLTFPLSFDNVRRIEVNNRFRDLARKHFSYGGMWFTEVHTGKSYKSRKGEIVKGNPLMIGKFHFHYKVITSDDRVSVLAWLRKQQSIDGVRSNSYDLSLSGDDLHIYAAAYSAKKEQKAYMMFGNRPWASWGVNKKPIKVDHDTMMEQFTMGMNKEESRFVVTGNEYPVKIFKLRERDESTMNDFKKEMKEKSKQATKVAAKKKAKMKRLNKRYEIV